MVELAHIIRHARTARAWSQEQLAEAAGMSLRTVQRVERGLPCAGEKLQALAAALELDAAALVAAAPAEREPRILGVSPAAVFWISAALCAPCLMFVVTNFGFYELNWAWIEPALPERLFGRWFDNIVMYLGLPLLAIVLSVTQVLGVRWRQGPRSLIIEGVVLRWRPAQWAVAVMAGGLFSIVAILVAVDHLHEMVGR